MTPAEGHNDPLAPSLRQSISSTLVSVLLAAATGLLATEKMQNPAQLRPASFNDTRARRPSATNWPTDRHPSWRCRRRGEL